MEKSLSINSKTGIITSARPDSLFVKIVLGILNNMNKGNLNVVFPWGEEMKFGGDDSSITANIKITDPRFFKKVVLYGDIGFGEAYVEGYWETESITNVISWMILNVENNPAISGGSRRFSPISILKYINKVYHKMNLNSRTGSRRNISSHYDLNNDFFRLWLDESMTYSSAIFKSEQTTLLEGQIEKYDRICRELKLKPTDHVLEIGCGWGGFSAYAAKNYGCRITAVTISKEQFDFALKRINDNNLSGQVEVLLKDYRDIEGQFDKIVSIEMIEAVGHEFLPAYFSKIDQLLKKDGAVALQAITSHDSNYKQLRKGVDWIQKHIFPGSLLPSIGIINEVVNKTSNMHLHSLMGFGYDYARTLKEWREKFNSRVEDIMQLKFDTEFVRKWNYYLSYCEAAFKMRNINVVQLVYTRPNNRNL